MGTKCLNTNPCLRGRSHPNDNRLVVFCQNEVNRVMAHFSLEFQGLEKSLYYDYPGGHGMAAFASARPFVIDVQKGGRIWRACFITEILYLFIETQSTGHLKWIFPSITVIK